MQNSSQNFLNQLSSTQTEQQLSLVDYPAMHHDAGQWCLHKLLFPCNYAAFGERLMYLPVWGKTARCGQCMGVFLVLGIGPWEGRLMGFFAIQGRACGFLYCPLVSAYFRAIICWKYLRHNCVMRPIF